MSNTKRWAFDVEVEGEDSYYGIRDLFRLADESKASQKYDECLDFLLRAAASPRGKFKLAKFYLETPEINLSQSARFCEAEKLLLDLHPHCIAACIELSILYLDKLSRPIAALAYLLRAKNLGANIEPVLIERCKDNIIRSGIAETEDN